MEMSEPSSKDYYEILMRHLEDDRRILDISRDFLKLTTNADRVEFAYLLFQDYDLLPAIFKDAKDAANALTLRQKGNEMYKLKKNEEALEFYTKSIAFSPCSCKSECLSLAYANRSAVLFETGLYDECLIDIDHALSENYPENLKSKLYARKEKCLKMQKPNMAKPYHQPLPEIPKEQQNALIQCASDALEIATSSDQGRHVIAARNIPVGEILAVEKPFCHILLESLTIHCHHCLKLCYCLIPCENCTETLYCSEACRISASSYHKYECRILKSLRLSRIDKLDLLPTKIALLVKNLYTELDQIENSFDEEVYRSDRYNEIHHLKGNTSKRSMTDLFARSATAAVIYHFFKNYSDFFDNENVEIIFKELVLKHLQTCACNFHEISELAMNKLGVYEPEQIGAGAYSFLSMFNHSCSPNLIRDCYGSTIVLRALKSIKKGEQCYENYGHLYAMTPKLTRVEKLRKQYFFECACPPCKEDWPLYSELPVKQTKIQICVDEEFESLAKGDSEHAKKALNGIKKKVSLLQRYEPDRSFAEFLELLKQCYAVFGNIRRSL